MWYTIYIQWTCFYLAFSSRSQRRRKKKLINLTRANVVCVVIFCVTSLRCCSSFRRKIKSCRRIMRELWEMASSKGTHTHPSYYRSFHSSKWRQQQWQRRKKKNSCAIKTFFCSHCVFAVSQYTAFSWMWRTMKNKNTYTISIAARQIHLILCCLLTFSFFFCIWIWIFFFPFGIFYTGRICTHKKYWAYINGFFSVSCSYVDIRDSEGTKQFAYMKSAP